MIVRCFGVALTGPGHSGYAPSPQAVSAIRRVSLTRKRYMVKPTAIVRAERLKAQKSAQRPPINRKLAQPSFDGNRTERRAARKWALISQRKEARMTITTVSALIEALSALPASAPVISLRADREGVILVPQDNGSVLITSPDTDIKDS